MSRAKSVPMFIIAVIAGGFLISPALGGDQSNPAPTMGQSASPSTSASPSSPTPPSPSATATPEPTPIVTAVETATPTRFREPIIGRVDQAELADPNGDHIHWTRLLPGGVTRYDASTTFEHAGFTVTTGYLICGLDGAYKAVANGGSGMCVLQVVVDHPGPMDIITAIPDLWITAKDSGYPFAAMVDPSSPEFGYATQSWSSDGTRLTEGGTLIADGSWSTHLVAFQTDGQTAQPDQLLANRSPVGTVRKAQ